MKAMTLHRHLPDIPICTDCYFLLGTTLDEFRRIHAMIEEPIQRVIPSADRVCGPSKQQEALRFNMDLPFRRVFYPLGFSVEIFTNEEAVLAAAEESFGHVRARRRNTPLEIRVGVSYEDGKNCPPEPTRREYNHLYSLVANAENQAILDLKTCTSFAWLTKSAVENRLYFRTNFLEKVVYLLLGASVVTDLHAACVSKNGRGILLFGDSGAGKSTLAYGCARAGWTYTSDDTSYLINDTEFPRVIGHSHRVRFRPTAKALFPELEGRALTPRLEGKPSIEVPISDLPVVSTAAEVTVDGIVYLNRRPSSKARLIQLPRGTATQFTCRELYSAGEIRAKHEQILEVLWDIPTFEMEYCDLDEGIQALELLTLKK
jgi:hypothetical protein